MRILTTFILAWSATAYAIGPMDTILADAQSEAFAIKKSCIDTPPVTSPQIAWCTGHYATYVGYLTQLQAPNPLTINLGLDGYVSPYAWSVYDICRYEPGRLINDGIC